MKLWEIRKDEFLTTLSSLNSMHCVTKSLYTSIYPKNQPCVIQFQQLHAQHCTSRPQQGIQCMMEQLNS